MRKDAMITPALYEFIKLTILNESRAKQAYLSGGRISEWGSDDHIKDLEEQIEEISRRKSRESKGSARRAEWAKVESRLRAELKSAKRKAQVKALNEKEEA